MVDSEVIEKHLFTRPDHRGHADLKDFRSCLRESAPFHIMPDEELWKVARRGTGVRLHKHERITIEPVDGLLVVLKGCLKRESEVRRGSAPLLLETRESYDCSVGLLDKVVYVASKETWLLTVSTSAPSSAASLPLRPVELSPMELDADESTDDGPKASTIYKRTRSRLAVQSSGGDGSWKNLRRSLLSLDASLDAAGVVLGRKARGRARSTGGAVEGGGGSSQPSKKPRTAVPATMPSHLPVKAEYSVTETSQVPSMASAEATNVTPSTSEDEAPLSDLADDNVGTAAGGGGPEAECKADDDAAKGSSGDVDVAMGGSADAATDGLRSGWAASSSSDSSSSSGDVVVVGGAVEEQRGVTIASRRIVRAATQVEMGMADHLIKKVLLGKLTERLKRTAADIQLMDINMRVNKTYNSTKAIYPLAPEFLVFHGSSYDACLGIAARNFNKAENRGEGRLNYFVSTDPAVADRWARARTDKLGGRASIVVSKLLFMRDADIRTSGCTGGTIRIPYACPHLLKPTWIVRYTPAAEPMPVSGDGWKVALEQSKGAVRAALCKHIIMTRHKAPAFDEPLRG